MVEGLVEGTGSFGARTGQDPLGVDGGGFRVGKGADWVEALCIGHSGLTMVSDRAMSRDHDSE